MKLMAWFVVAASLLAANGAMAQTPEPARSGCPAGYRLTESLCLNSSTGDVVLATPPARSDDKSGSR